MHEQAVKRSPQYTKISHASAISLGLMGGRMYRGAVNKCVNLLVHYPEGCSANCAYCGLAKKRPGSYEEKSFIHVDWPIYHMSEIIEAINQAPSYVKRTCISMITNGRCRKDTITMTRQLKEKTRLPISILISPTILKQDDLKEMKDAGADKVGIAIDLATEELFDQYRGKGVNGPHRWETYWRVLEWALEIFGSPNVGVHLMVGMGETEQQMVSLMDQLWDMGVVNHLFSFFAEKGSRLADRPQPPWPTYLRIQLARYLIEEGLSRFDLMTFDAKGRIRDFGLPGTQLDSAISLGKPFMTTGCLGDDGEVACNRPFGNCLPDVKQWNYPYPPNEEELVLIKQHVFTYPEA
ncbi:MAG: radical SAM protein [Deltaproteobacteria bacterium]|nr:radical SAM protein [Deltaproteobacteria bacterium]